MINLEEIPCQEANMMGICIPGTDDPVPCGRTGPGARVVFHQRDGRNVYVMCMGCADHNIRNRGGVELRPSLAVRSYEPGDGCCQTCLTSDSQHDNYECWRQDCPSRRGGFDERLVDRRLNHAGCVGLMADLTGHIGADMESQEVLESVERCMADFVKLNGGTVVRNFNRIEWEPPQL